MNAEHQTRPDYPYYNDNLARLSLIDWVIVLAAVRYDDNTVRPHSSLGNQTPQHARRALEQFEGSAPGSLASDEAPEYQNPTRRLSL
tara:strand:+ start:411 stop:671 length:261 start_codon:yes stop_codon:yes gene_type:complete